MSDSASLGFDLAGSFLDVLARLTQLEREAIARDLAPITESAAYRDAVNAARAAVLEGGSEPGPAQVMLRRRNAFLWEAQRRLALEVNGQRRFRDAALNVVRVLLVIDRPGMREHLRMVAAPFDSVLQLRWTRARERQAASAPPPATSQAASPTVERERPMPRAEQRPSDRA